MLAHPTGMIGLPLRLLAREVYLRVVAKVGPDKVALVTGEEKIKPDRPRYWICTIEAMPRDLDVAYVAIDEIQLAADMDRGHVFTDRLLYVRGREETLLIGSSTMLPLVQSLIPNVHTTTRPRLSQLTFAGEKRLSRLPRRTAIVAFSAEEVYAIAELIRRQRGGAAVVLGALSPRTRNAQVEMYQAGDVDYLVATDAVGMGLNLDVDHVAFAANWKYDGTRFRKLTPAEMGQIAGRAGRHLADGTFGSTGRCPPFEAELVERLESHDFDPLRILQWRNPDLSFGSLEALQASLDEHPRESGLTRAPMGEDQQALEILMKEDDIRDTARSAATVRRLWDVCGVPDYRKVHPQVHADLVAQLYRFLMKGMAGRIPDTWFAEQVAMIDRTDGDIDTLSRRIAHGRTWTFVANRPDWLRDPEHWQGETRRVEDRLSDALHERLASRFVDRRTSVLMRRLRENTMLEAQITADGDVTVEGQHVGHLHGFLFVPDASAEGHEAKTLRSAAEKALAGRDRGAGRPIRAPPPIRPSCSSHDGTIRWTGAPVAKLNPGEKLFAPQIRLLADDSLTGAHREKVEARLDAWLKAYIVRLLGPLMEIETAADLTGLAKGIGYQVVEALGRAGALEGGAGDAQPRPGRPRRAAPPRRPLRRLPHLPAGPAEAGAPHARGAALGPAQRRPRPARPRRDRASRRLRPDLDQGRSRDRQGPLPRGRLPGQRRAGGARRHPGAARRPDPPGDRLPARHHAGRPAGRDRRRRRLRGHRRHDLAGRLLGRGFRLDPEVAGLQCRGAPRPGHHGAAGPGGRHRAGRRRRRDVLRRGGRRAGGRRRAGRR